MTRIQVSGSVMSLYAFLLSTCAAEPDGAPLFETTVDSGFDTTSQEEPNEDAGNLGMGGAGGQATTEVQGGAGGAPGSGWGIEFTDAALPNSDSGSAGMDIVDASQPDGNTGSAGMDIVDASEPDGNGSVDPWVPDGPCDVSEPPADVAAWVSETLAGEGGSNLRSRTTWLFDSSMQGSGQINVCVRYGATRQISTETRDQIGVAMDRWMNQWFGALGHYDCFSYSSVTVTVTGWAVKPGQESLLQWSDDTMPIYTEVSDGRDQAAGEPKCPDSCAFFYNPSHAFPNCPGGEVNHFDYTLWMNDSMGGGAAAVGGDWGVRIPVDSVINALNVDQFGTILHEMGHGFGIPDYYTWTGSRPAGGSVMIVGSSRGGLTTGDTWMVRRAWSAVKALRYPD